MFSTKTSVANDYTTSKNCRTADLRELVPIQVVCRVDELHLKLASTFLDQKWLCPKQYKKQPTVDMNYLITPTSQLSSVEFTKVVKEQTL